MESRTQDIKGLKVYNLAEISEVTGISKLILRNCILAGNLKAVKISNRWRVTEDNLRAFLNGESNKQS